MDGPSFRLPAREPHRRRVLCALVVALLVNVTLVAGPAVGLARAAGPVVFVQGAATSTGTRVASSTVALTGAVTAGDLLVGWVAEYNATGQVQVSDNINGAWTRAPEATAFQNGTGDIALYYLANSKAAASVQITVSAAAPAYLQGAIGDYSGTATAGPLDQIVSNRGVGTAVDAGTTPAVPAGELVFSALVTGGNPTSTTAGTGFTARAHTGSGSAFAEDILAATAGPQHGTATLATSTDWYAVTATFRA